ncbi:MAG: hypothetical protein L0Y72_10785 [Gemmataceae bacterium]|nr:hypothetical protein [Gemmataceae bacterium]MCI0739520.1 hypothetical protein [Gemmataceae bacterium]
MTFKIGGKKALDFFDWLLELKIGNQTVDLKKVSLYRLKDGTEGAVDALSINVPAGKHKVKIKVKLLDGTTATDERDVTFQIVIEECSLRRLDSTNFGLGQSRYPTLQQRTGAIEATGLRTLTRTMTPESPRPRKLA